jgi:hypothetical protein
VQGLSNHCDALFDTVRARCNSVPLMKLEPAVEELLLIRDLRYARLRDFEWRLRSREAIGPELYKLLEVDLIYALLEDLPLQNQQ